MIHFTRQTLDNGLRVIVHQDRSTPLVAVNILYDTGSKDEDPENTGLAHLLEHLMFGGSVNIPSYDKVVQKAGGENNAFTSNDITNYYVQLPAVNLETALWLESDRMQGLVLNQKGLDIQKSVVIEEYKQRYLNAPYGDIWMLLRPLAYKIHPYMWPVIGKQLSDIENITIDHVSDFYGKHYCPANAILTIAGNVDTDKSIRLSEKWFGKISDNNKPERNLPCEPEQVEARTLIVKREVPYHEIVLAFKICGRKDPAFPLADLISDLLGGGRSSRLYRRLVMESNTFNNINAYITGDTDPGLLIIRGRLAGNTDPDQGYRQLRKELDRLIIQGPGNRELDKVINKFEATRQYTNTSILSKAMELAYFELLGDAELLNREIKSYREVTGKEIQTVSQNYLDEKNSSTLFYLSNSKPVKS